jgi:hypothetical protein
MVDTVRDRELHEVHHHEDAGGGWAIAAIVIIALILLLIFGLPALRDRTPDAAPAVSVPEAIDINFGGGAGADVNPVE